MSPIISIQIAIILLAGLLINKPLIYRPLSNDDGNWFYLAVFWRQGERPYKTINNSFGYFNIQLLFAAIFNLLRLNNLRSINYFKGCYYTLNALSIYWLCYAFWSNPWIALASAILFLVITVVPNTLFMLTYAEHFFILPVNLALTLAVYAISQDALWLYALSGVATAWAFQIKPTCLLIAVALGLAYIIIPAGLTPACAYSAVFLGIYLLPFLLMGAKNHTGHKQYRRTTLGHFEILTKTITSRIQLLSNKNETPAPNSKPLGYTENLYSIPFKERLKNLHKNLSPGLRDLRCIVFLGCIGIFMPSSQAAWQAWSLIGLTCAYLIMFYIPKNYFTPHFNPVWAPLCILATKTAFDLFAMLQGLIIMQTLLAAILAYEAIRLGRISAQSFGKSQATKFGYFWEGLGLLFKLAETVGRDMAALARPNDRLLIWGDHPTIHLFSRVPAWRKEHMFVYALQSRPPALAKILEEFRIDPPELVQFYNWNYKDEWSMEYLSANTGIPYRLIKDFALADDQGRIITTGAGITLSFPLYRRNDDAYCEILLDRAILAQENNKPREAHSLLNQILNIRSYHYEAALHLELMELGHNERKELLTERSANEPSPRRKAVQQRLLADLELQAGDSAEALRIYQQVIGINRGDFRAYLRLGEIHFMAGKLETAYQCFRQSIEVHPYSADAFNNLGVLKIQTGNPREALELFERALRLNPTHPDAKANLESLTANNPPALTGENPCAE